VCNKKVLPSAVYSFITYFDHCMYGHFSNETHSGIVLGEGVDALNYCSREH
jgi:hypothetical protein